MEVDRSTIAQQHSAPRLIWSGRPKSRWKKPLFIFGTIVACAIMTLAILFVIYWPFTQRKVVEDLQIGTHTSVVIQKFHRTYFPPGFIAEGLTFRRPGAQPSDPPVITAEKLTGRANYVGLLHKHVSLLRAEGLHVLIPAFGTGWPVTKSDQKESSCVIDDLFAGDAVLEVVGHEAHSLRFLVHRFDLRGLGSKSALAFDTALTNPEPRGEITMKGSFGPWNDAQPHKTLASGSYTFTDADLSPFGGVAGHIASQGTFRGPLDQLDATGSADIPDFMVTHSHHPVHITADFQVRTDATTGDVFIRKFTGHYLHTTVHATGSVAQKAGEKRVGLFDLAVDRGRIEDVLFLFVKEPKSPFEGETNFRAHVIWPGGPQKFVRKITLSGNFDITEGVFTKPSTQESIDKLSAQGQGQPQKADDPPPTSSHLFGDVLMKNGNAEFSDLILTVPGAKAHMHGSYDLVTERVNLNGKLMMDAQLPQATSGFKSFFLKVLSPLLKKNRHGGAKMDVRITGTYDHPQYAADAI